MPALEKGAICGAVRRMFRRIGIDIGVGVCFRGEFKMGCRPYKLELANLQCGQNVDTTTVLPLG